MDALIFAAGLGTRLKPFTLEHPKALAPVGGVPMLQRVILKLKAAGIGRMVVNVHHFADQIIDFLQANGNFGVDIAISDERSLLLDTGGGILAARKWLSPDAPVLVHNADILTDFDLNKMIAAHSRSGADGTLLVAERDTSRYLLMDNDLHMRGWTNVKTGEVRMPKIYDANGGETHMSDSNAAVESLRKMAFGGVHVISPSALDALESYAGEEKAFPIMPFYIAECGGLDIRGYVPSEPYRWLDIGKPESLDRANALFV